MPRPDGFTFMVRGAEVLISHRGKLATTLRGPRAAEFLAAVDGSDPQLVMARATGNYRRGNERLASEHPRNRGR